MSAGFAMLQPKILSRIIAKDKRKQELQTWEVPLQKKSLLRTAARKL